MVHTAEILHTRGSICGHARLPIVVFVIGGKALAASTRKIDNERRGRGPCDCATDIALMGEDLVQRRTEVFKPMNHITLVDVVLGTARRQLFLLNAMFGELGMQLAVPAGC